MTGEVKRYAFYDRHTGVEVDPTEILPGDTTNDDTFIASADHLAVAEGLRARAEKAEAELAKHMPAIECANAMLAVARPLVLNALRIDEAMRGGDGRG